MFRPLLALCPLSSRRIACLAAIALMIVCLGGTAKAESRSEWLPNRPVKESKWKKVWKWSAAALMAGNAMDVASSYGYQEANGLLRSGNGQLNHRGTAIKFGIMAGALVGQHYLLKENPEMEKPLAITNFAVGVAYSGIAVRNWKVR
ncbi:MAG: hypothetical protein U5J83_05965 [Bryobacterales bacterium]|nr:hypothetical protein [Bryobacterales bacterium]